MVSCHCHVAPFAGYQRVQIGADADDLGPIPARVPGRDAERVAPAVGEAGDTWLVAFEWNWRALSCLPPEYGHTMYALTGEPLVLTGAAHRTVARPLPADAVGERGADGHRRVRRPRRWSGGRGSTTVMRRPRRARA